MKKALLVLFTGLMFGSLAAQATMPAPPPKSEAEKKAEADKAAAAKAKSAAETAQAQDRAVANYKRNHGVAKPAQGKKK